MHSRTTKISASMQRPYARLDVDGDRLQIAFRRLPFDRDAVLAAIDASGMPHADHLRAAWRR